MLLEALEGRVTPSTFTPAQIRTAYGVSAIPAFGGTLTADGTTVEERPVSALDLLATVCKVVGVDPDRQNVGPGGRPIRIVDTRARPIEEIL